jgi:hypothetical protein
VVDEFLQQVRDAPATMRAIRGDASTGDDVNLIRGLAACCMTLLDKEAATAYGAPDQAQH